MAALAFLVVLGLLALAVVAACVVELVVVMVLVPFFLVAGVAFLASEAVPFMMGVAGSLVACVGLHCHRAVDGRILEVLHLLSDCDMAFFLHVSFSRLGLSAGWSARCTG